MTNPLLTSAEEPFAVGESDFAFFDADAVRIDSGALLFCIQGAAELETDQFNGTIQRHTVAALLPDTTIRLHRITDDFRIRYFVYSRDMLVEIASRFDLAFFRILRERPLFDLSDTMAEGMLYWFKIVDYTYHDRGNIFRTTITRNRLQNVFLDVYDKMQRFSSHFRQQRSHEVSGRQNELLLRFISLVKEHCHRERSVAFYADKLCISTRYLAAIVRNTAHEPVKAIIDRAVILKIKELLQSTDLSVQEIAFRLHFPDQSYLGRYFKKLTGQSPSAFRNARK